MKVRVDFWVSVGIHLYHLTLKPQVSWDKLEQKKVQLNEAGMFCDFTKVPGTSSQLKYTQLQLSQQITEIRDNYRAQVLE